MLPSQCSDGRPAECCKVKKISNILSSRLTQVALLAIFFIGTHSLPRRKQLQKSDNCDTKHLNPM